jgi:hypothetical protein
MREVNKVETKIESEKIDEEESIRERREDFVMKYGWFIPDLHQKHIAYESEG